MSPDDPLDQMCSLGTSHVFPCMLSRVRKSKYDRIGGVAGDPLFPPIAYFIDNAGLKDAKNAKSSFSFLIQSNKAI